MLLELSKRFQKSGYCSAVFKTFRELYRLPISGNLEVIESLFLKSSELVKLYNELDEEVEKNSKICELFFKCLTKCFAL